MLPNDLPADVQESLLFRSCGSAEAYRQAKAEIAAAERRDLARLYRLSTPIHSAERPSIPRDDSPLDLARFDQLMRLFPDDMRAILAAAVTDIIDEYIKGLNGLEAQS